MLPPCRRKASEIIRLSTSARASASVPVPVVGMFDGGIEVIDAAPEGVVGDEVRFALAPDDGDNGPQASTVHPLGKHKIVEPRSRA